MKKWKIGLAALIAGVGMAGVAQAAELDMHFQPLDKYRDLGRSVSEREDIQKALSAHFQRLAERLPAGQTLKIDLLEINRAGEMDFRQRLPDQIRVMREVTWPQMDFSYALLEGGKEIKSGKASLSDMNYLHGSTVRYTDGDPLRYEKPMIDKWFDAEFGKAAR
ncbi:DUF3016 domain-containing protein [Roseateles sp. DB2]|uniref:DUF3016 domain-containing protein n=1 Tax=Roseateles sp. DB2 TaxID=3453717 RepID=UPI003EE820E0